MLIKLWIISTRKMLNKPTSCLLEIVCTVLIEIFGFVDGLSYLCHSCYYWISISRQTLELVSFWSYRVHFLLKLRAQIKKKSIQWNVIFHKGWTLFLSMIHFSHNIWLTDDHFSFQGSRFFQANDGSTTKVPHVLIHSSRWKFCGAIWCEQRNHGWRIGSKCYWLTGKGDLWM